MFTQFTALKVIVLRDLQLANARPPIDVTPSGITILLSDVQP
jgi:hypothetical protein